MYASNAAALSTDSIKVRAWSGCGNSATKGFKLSNAALAVPAAPTAITITPLVTNVCGNRTYRYSAPALTTGSGTIAPATGWVWSFKGTLGLNAVIDSGDLTSQKLVVRYTSNAASGAGDSVKVYYTSLCGNSLAKAAKLSNSNNHYSSCTKCMRSEVVPLCCTELTSGYSDSGSCNGLVMVIHWKPGSKCCD
jgi:hypothetical protein